MKQAIHLILLITCATSFALAVFGMGGAVAGEAGDYLFAPQSNNIWILKKSTRKMVLVGYENPQKPWKSKTVTIPDDFQLGHSMLTAVGIRGTAAFLQDSSTGKVVFFHAQDDGSVNVFEGLDVAESLQ